MPDVNAKLAADVVAKVSPDDKKADAGSVTKDANEQTAARVADGEDANEKTPALADDEKAASDGKKRETKSAPKKIAMKKAMRKAATGGKKSASKDGRDAEDEGDDLGSSGGSADAQGELEEGKDGPPAVPEVITAMDLMKRPAAQEDEVAPAPEKKKPRNKDTEDGRPPMIQPRITDFASINDLI
ncbi:unnamed protein product [Amoebophrya sp. A25]|nr:unnamed protein product [Amoebophrya sp. A25]|eukprot:GSA25T00009946001.1